MKLPLSIGHVNWCCHEGLFRQPHCWYFMSTTSQPYTEDCLTADSLVLKLQQSFHPFFHDLLWVLGAGVVLPMYRLWLLSCSLDFGQFWLSAIVSVCCKMKLLWWGVADTLMCGYKDQYLEYSYTLFWLRKTAVEGSLVSISSIGSLSY